MQTQAIGTNPQFTSNKSYNKQRIDKFIALNDFEIRRACLNNADKITEHDKHQKISKGIFYSIPLVAGAAAAILTKGNTKILGKSFSGLSAKFANGLAAGGYWAGLLGAVTLVDKGVEAAEKSSPTLRKAERKHPFLSFAANVGAIALTVLGATKGLSYLASKIKPKTIAKASLKAGDIAKKINNSYILQSLSNSINNVTNKIPSPLKNIGKSILSWSPEITLVGGIFHSIDHNSKRNRVFNESYSDIKNEQLRVAQERLEEEQSFCRHLS